MSGHLGVEMYAKVSSYFYWPGLGKDIVQFCRSCHTCQMVGKPNKPLPAFQEPFSRTLIDCIALLAKSQEISTC